ncbi:hypothetical protein V6Z12_D02G145300 [Gossypium hirsutum]
MNTPTVKEEEMENEDEAGAEKKSVIIPLPQKVAAAETPPSVTEESPNNRNLDHQNHNK